ncbi:hypothetical protein [Acrocarpospora corrugata]|uniref:hypothetical protein n=1 Tax=Acrocarpospora corrugata TaxID=35763 RepID=UPI00147834D9|nr:hypothetical protein [Acrocarpospora corrugata]
MVRARGKVVATALAVVVSVFVSTIGVPDGLVTSASAAELPEPMKENSVAGRPLAVPSVEPGAEDLHKPPVPRAVVWPKAGSGEVAVGAKPVAVGSLPVKVGPPEPLLQGSSPVVGQAGKPLARSDAAAAQQADRATGVAPARVKVQTFDEATARRIGGVGGLFGFPGRLQRRFRLPAVVGPAARVRAGQCAFRGMPGEDGR